MESVTAQLVMSSLLYASEEMGIALRNASYSPNIKERMDHSAALFDNEGRLLAQAEHIPVHLGSLPWGLSNALSYCDNSGLELEAGCMVVVNNPYIAGTHLNDVTVVGPIYRGSTLVGFAANKAHHSDLGGIAPGSISMGSRQLSEEGFVTDPIYLVRRGEFERKTLEAFSSHSRMPRERLGDLRAQVAANVTGTRRVLRLIEKYGLTSFREAASQAFLYAAKMTSLRLASMKRGSFQAQDFLEAPDGRDLVLRARVTISREGIVVDYTGTNPQVESPLNAVYGVTLSGVYFVVRTLAGDDIPANHGAFASIRVIAPEGCLLNPTYPHPVGGGNVETSQRNADLLFKALSKAVPKKCPAASGGSMNNVMAGGPSWAFYETIGVGLGAKAGLDGIDGIQSNMTNTMNTPVEEVERGLPLMVTRYEFREDSSGPGEFRGGSGIIRRYRSLNPSATFTILSERERHSPWGLFGGGDGARTKVVLVRRGSAKRVPSKGTYVLHEGDEIEIHTAGGGGYGRPSDRRAEEIRRDLDDDLISRSYAKQYYGFGSRSR
jgi:N-methylhydantoinase B